MTLGNENLFGVREEEEDKSFQSKKVGFSENCSFVILLKNANILFR